jgi:hypothetical protein
MVKRPKPVREWSRGRVALFLALLLLAMSAFGGLVMPRLASNGVPQSLTKASPERTVHLVRRKVGKQCQRRLYQRVQMHSPLLLTPADR